MMMIKQICLLLGASVLGTAAEPIDLQKTLKGVEDRYNKIQTLQVKFTEKTT